MLRVEKMRNDILVARWINHNNSSYVFTDNILIKMRMSNPNQEPLVSSKAPNQGLKDMDFFASSQSR